MKKDTAKLISRAEACLEEAHHLLAYDHYLGAINRAYYCIFDCARALLHENEIFAKTHQGVQTKFNDAFIKTGLIQRNHGNAMRHLFALRQASDYDFDAELTREDAVYANDMAAQFLQTCKH